MKKKKLRRDYYIGLCVMFAYQNIHMSSNKKQKYLKKMLLAIISLDLGREADSINLDEYINNIIFDAFNLNW